MKKFSIHFITLFSSLCMISCGTGIGGYGVGSGDTPTGSISELSAIDGTTDVLPTAKFQYTFSKSVDTSTVATSTFFLVQTPTASISPKAALDTTVCDSNSAIAASIDCYTDKKCVLTPVASLSYASGYTACLTTGILYADGSRFTGESFSFTTASITADAGPTQDVDLSASVTLDGSGSAGPEGMTLTYAWTQVSGETVELSDATAEKPTFTAGDSLQDYVFQLIVNDGISTSAASTVRVRVWIDADNSLFVDASSTAETPDGSKTSPYTTISEAVAASTNGADVYVAAGSYTESVSLAEGASIYGGFESANWTRDIDTNTVSLGAPSDPCTGACTPLNVPDTSTITADTVIDGLTVTGANRTDENMATTIGITNGSALTITNNTLIGGNTSAGTGGVIVVNCGSPSNGGCGEGLVISDNTITLGSSGDYSMGIGLLGACTATISGNTISGSDTEGFTADGITLINAQADDGTYGSCTNVAITGNTSLYLGSVTTSSSDPDRAIFLQDDTVATISDNTMTAAFTAASGVDGGINMIFLYENAAATISGNTISGTSSDTYSSAGDVIMIKSSSDSDTTISNNTINAGKNAGTGITYGIWISSDSTGTGITIDGNPLINAGEGGGGSYGISVVGDNTADVTVSNNDSISGSSDTDYSSTLSAMIALSGTGNYTVETNDLIDAGENAGGPTTAIAVSATGASVDIKRNKIVGGNGVINSTTNPGSSGITITGSNASGVTTENNIIYAGNGYNESTGPDAISIILAGSGEINVINNTIYLGVNIESSNLKVGIANLSTANKNIVNNILIQDSSVTSAQQTLRYVTTGFTAFTSVYNNDFLVISNQYFYAKTNPSGALTQSLADMVTKLNLVGTLNGGNIDDAPSFQAGSDYLLSADSPNIGAGCSSSASCNDVTLPTDDFDGNPRTGAYDIGASQY